MKKMKVLFVAAEAAGFIKVGGLGDVAGELPCKLKESGADVCLVIPAHQEIDAATREISEFTVKWVTGRNLYSEGSGCTGDYPAYR